MIEADLPDFTTSHIVIILVPDQITSRTIQISSRVIVTIRRYFTYDTWSLSDATPFERHAFFIIELLSTDLISLELLDSDPSATHVHDVFISGEIVFEKLDMQTDQADTKHDNYCVHDDQDGQQHKCDHSTTKADWWSSPNSDCDEQNEGLYHV